MSAWTDGGGARRGPLPIRYADADRILMTELLTMLCDHLFKDSPTREDSLAELAMAAAVVARCGRWQPLTIHAALRAGASLPEAAAATGLEPGEVVRRWRAWADVQSVLVIGGHPAVDPDEVRTIADRLDREIRR
ncbi:MAG: hypothetical protein HKP61_17660 [Dactylosporangium sp.]|nr:hypothetical protein [Dactylosporangium sp.]NNJ62725.1 hypothetical protein [Dactylosporangium sp.]